MWKGQRGLPQNPIPNFCLKYSLNLGILGYLRNKNKKIYRLVYFKKSLIFSRGMNFIEEMIKRRYSLENANIFWKYK